MSDNETKSNNSKGKPDQTGYGLFDLIGFALLDVIKLMRTLKFAIWVLILLAVFTLIGSILPQEHLAGDLDEFRMQYTNLFRVNSEDGTNTFGEVLYHGLVVPFQLYNIFKSGHYIALVLLLGISSALCAWDKYKATRKLLRLIRPKAQASSVKALEHSSEGAVDIDLIETGEHLRESLRKRGYEVFSESEEGKNIWFLIRKNAFRHWVSVAFHSAWLIIIVGGIIGDERFLGYDGHFWIEEGQTEILGDDYLKYESAQIAGRYFDPVNEEIIYLVDYVNIYRERDFGELDPVSGFPSEYMGQPSDYISHLKILTPGEDLTEYSDATVHMERKVEVNYPLRYKGIGYYQSSVNSRIAISVTLPDGRTELVESWLNQRFTLPGLDASFVVTLADIVGGIWETEDGTQTEIPHRIRLVDYTPYMMGTSARPVTLGYLTINEPVTIDGIVISLVDVTELAGLSFVHDPGVPIVYFGGFFLIIGLTVGLYWPFRQGRVVLTASTGDRTKYTVGGNWSDFPELVETIINGQVEGKAE
jgi:cytochrome c biogenesis protein ResB